MIEVINNHLEFLFLPNMLSPVVLLPTRENFAALNVLAFLFARSNPATVNLFMLPPTLCQASPKNHSTVLVLFVLGLIFLPFDTQ